MRTPRPERTIAVATSVLFKVAELLNLGLGKSGPRAAAGDSVTLAGALQMGVWDERTCRTASVGELFTTPGTLITDVETDGAGRTTGAG